MTGDDLSRRALLRRGAVAASAGTLASVAGCGGLNPFGGGGASYTAWMAAPGEIRDREHYQYTFYDTAILVANEDAMSSGTDLSFLERSWRPVGLDVDETSWLLSAGGVSVVNVSAFDRESIVGDLEDAGFDDDTEQAGYTIYLNGNGGRAVGVGNGRLLVSSVSSPVDAIETVIEVNNGSADRYVSESDAMRELTNQLGSGAIVSGRTTAEVSDGSPPSGRFDGMVGRGRRIRINGDTSNYKWVVVFEESGDVDTDALEEWVEANEDGQFADVDDISYSQSGRTGVITGTADTADI